MDPLGLILLSTKLSFFVNWVEILVSELVLKANSSNLRARNMEKQFNERHIITTPIRIKVTPKAILGLVAM